MGTVAYMAPEQLNGEAADARADVFAFGIVLYELLTRQHPFRKQAQTSTLNAILHESPLPPVSLVPDLPPAASGIVQRCLAKARKERYPDAEALAQALAAVAETSPEVAIRGRADEGAARPRDGARAIGSPSPAAATPQTIPRTITQPALLRVA